MTSESRPADVPGVVHVVGVAGVGMSAVAQALLDQGVRVSGSDRYLDSGDRLPVLDQLERAGVRLVRQDGQGVQQDTEAVVVSTAIENDNADLEAARLHDVPVVHRAAMLARLVEGHPTVAVTGTAGKTTVTAMLGHLLAELGESPSVVNGGAVVQWAGPDRVGNVRHGIGTRWVIEADESDRSLLQFHPDWAVITNISKDHFSLDEVTDLFRRFAAQVRKGIVCGPGVVDILRRIRDANGPAEWIEVRPQLANDGDGWSTCLEGATCRVPMPGKHNAVNAAMALHMAHQLGHDPHQLVAAMTSFRGVERRLQVVGDVGGVQVIDDYAHNPAKIAATWRAVAETHARILGVWRPHGFGPLALMMDEFVEAWSEVSRPDDRLFLLPVYYVGGTASQEVSSEDLARRLQDMGVNVGVFSDYCCLRAEIKAAVCAGDAVVVMGARDPGLPRFARELVTQLGSA